MNILTAQNLEVKYRQYVKPSDALLEFMFRKPKHEVFYALQAVSFELQAGQSLGIVGDNGAGKSTLLKALAGNVALTGGQLQSKGRISAILELGNGFHADFSGLENARLGLAIAGIFDQQTLQEVIAFAELGEFIEKPIKTYSSGMIVRLAFSVAIAVKPEILLVDEALSVGDQSFQKKSMDYMRSLIDQGTALVFCSHNLYQVKELCQRAIWLEKGQVKQLGEVNQVVAAYQDASRARQSKNVAMDNQDTEQASAVTVASPTLLSVSINQSLFSTGDCFEVSAKVDPANHDKADVHIGIVIRRNDDIQCYGISTLHEQYALQPLSNGFLGVRFVIDQLPLLSGQYCLEVWLIDRSGVHVYDSQERCCHFEVRQGSNQQGIGVAMLPHRWEVMHVE